MKEVPFFDAGIRRNGMAGILEWQNKNTEMDF